MKYLFFPNIIASENDYFANFTKILWFDFFGKKRNVLSFSPTPLAWNHFGHLYDIYTQIYYYVYTRLYDNVNLFNVYNIIIPIYYVCFV